MSFVRDFHEQKMVHLVFTCARLDSRLYDKKMLKNKDVSFKS